MQLYGRSVQIKSGMKEFVGKTGVIVNKEGTYYRVRLDNAVNVANVGSVTDDLWERSGFKLLRD